MHRAVQQDQTEFVKRTVIALSLAVAALVLLVAAYVARHALLVIYTSVLLAVGFSPLVRAIEHQKRIPVGTKRLPRWLAILIVYGVIIGVLAIIGVLVIPPLVRQAGEMWEQLPSYAGRVQQFLMDKGVLDHRVTLGEAVRQAPESASGSAVGTAATAVRWTMGLLVGLLTVVILTFYLLIESGTLFGAFTRMFSPANRPRIAEASAKITLKVSAWLNGQLILAGTIGSTAAIALWALGVPYFYVLALIAAVGEMIPVVGPLLSAVPAILVASTVSPQTALWVAVFFLIQQQVENHVLVPKLMERQVGVSPVTVIVALLIGGSVLGIIGAVLAVPTAAILQVVAQEILEEQGR